MTLDEVLKINWLGPDLDLTISDVPYYPYLSSRGILPPKKRSMRGMESSSLRADVSSVVSTI